MRSNTKKAKQIIRSEIRNSGFSPKNYGEGRSTLDNIKINADAHNAGMPKNRYVSDYTKCTSLVDGACFKIGSGQDRMLTKIYGKKKVDEWDGGKKHDIYKHLIGREYEAMLRERAAAKKTKSKTTKKR